MTIRTVGVLGAGLMGTGVAQVLAEADYKVILLDISEVILERARRKFRENSRLQLLLGKGPAAADPDQLLERVVFSMDIHLLKEVDFVIESVTEKWKVKERSYKQIDAICPRDIVFASNTSAIPITRIASATKRAPQVIGVHFMNPVPLKATVEMIRGYHTSDETVEVTKSLLSTMGKECILVRDSPGFVSNRVLMLTINEAIFLLYEQVSSAEEVDRIFKLCFGHKMGPLETADLIGLDTVLLSIEVLHESFNDSKYRPCPLLKKMVDAGLYGKKSGKGFYTY